ncbi:hypothetical protein G6M87_00470 [Rhizobium rhizogenes]|uniref:hypothetical protein n=1 Tax=Rhizobium rhizogenes TaxID=359 RepID=UPI001572F56B|nr:hypothetical protein [Rhizobium rhizogenes]NTI24195.1 hypothetical protein [Rhizobium rhizogenes]QTG04022.1 hypothetical protein G6M87_00470 [Rhizobium rhizogenes]
MAELAERIADDLGLTSEERDELVPSRRMTLIDGRELADLMMEHGVGVRRLPEAILRGVPGAILS